MKLIVGLGNPGSIYDNTRHNVGFMLLDYIFKSSSFVENKKMSAMEYITSINGEKVIIIKPLTYMNLSGESVIKYVNFYKINVDDILVIQDDLDMPLGRIKLIYNHGDGGHNGIKDITLKLSSKNFLRVKIGIGKSSLLETKDYVLGKFKEEERDKLLEVFLGLRDIVNDYVSMNMDCLLQKYNSKIRSNI